MTRACCQSKPTPAWCQPITTEVANSGKAVLANRAWRSHASGLSSGHGEGSPAPPPRPPTMYMGEPQSVAAIMLLWRYRAKPKSAVGEKARKQSGPDPGPPRPAAQRPAAQRPAAQASPILTRMLLGLVRRPLGLDSRMFWGFRSRWMMPLLCSSRMAPAICCRNSRMVSSLSVRMAVGRRRSGAASLLGQGPRGPSLLEGPPTWCHSHRRHVLLSTPGCPEPPICGPIWHLPPHTPPAQLRPAHRHLPAWQPPAAVQHTLPLAQFHYFSAAAQGRAHSLRPCDGLQAWSSNSGGAGRTDGGRGASAEGAARRLWQRSGNLECSGQAGAQQRSHQGHLGGPLNTGTSGQLCPARLSLGRPVHTSPPHGLGQGGPGCAAYLAIGRPLTVQVVSQVPAITVLQKTSHTPHSAARADPPGLPRPPRHPMPDPWALRHPASFLGQMSLTICA